MSIRNGRRVVTVVVTLMGLALIGTILEILSLKDKVRTLDIQRCKISSCDPKFKPGDSGTCGGM